jgi:hypothetical protein
MAYIVSADDDVIHAATHGIMDREDLSFLRDRMDSAMRSAGNYASSFLKEASTRLANFDLGKLRDRVSGLRDRFGKRWDDDRIVLLSTLTEIQNAKSRMRRYTMAEPRTRRLFQQGRLEGYGKLYEDEEPSAIGRDHTPYREVMNGAYDGSVEDEDRYTTYLEVADEYGDQPLSFDERTSVRHGTWAAQRGFLDEGKQDPVSPIKNTL